MMIVKSLALADNNSLSSSAQMSHALCLDMISSVMHGEVGVKHIPWFTDGLTTKGLVVASGAGLLSMS